MSELGGDGRTRRSTVVPAEEYPIVDSGERRGAIRGGPRRLIGNRGFGASTRYAVAVLGGGDMGYGLATRFPVHGQDVTLLGHRASNLEDARGRNRNAPSFLHDDGLSEVDPTAVGGSEFITDPAADVSNADDGGRRIRDRSRYLIIEAARIAGQ